MRIITRDHVGVYVEIDQRRGRILLTWEEIAVLQEEKARFLERPKAGKGTHEKMRSMEEKK